MSHEHPTEAAQGSSEASPDALTGQLLSGRYQVEECLGRGAMGAVYRARHTLMRKTVAIKVLHSQADDQPDLIERFRREAQAAANIDHPNICSASDFGQMPDGTFFLVIEFLEGHTLEDELDQTGALSVERTIHIGAQVAAALDRAHELDVVHRDLKPENIMLIERDGDADFVKILDFGVARVRLTDEHEQVELTQAGTVWGTPDYMSPEQALGEDVDGRSDLYSLGVILYEMLAGEPLFADQSPARVMALHMTVPPPAVRLDSADPAARRLEQLVGRLLEKSPDQRPQSARAVYDELHGRTSAPPKAASSSTDAPGGSSAGRRGVDEALQSARQLVDNIEAYTDRALAWICSQPDAVRWTGLLVSALVVVAMAAIPVVILVDASGFPDTEQGRQRAQRNLAEERAAFLKSAGLTDIPRLIDKNQTTAALEALAEVDEPYASNAHIAFLRGRVNGVRGRWRAAVKNYSEAVTAEPLYANDATLVNHVFKRFSDPNDHRAKAARTLIEAHLDTPFVTRTLADTATYSDSRRVRDRAFDVLDQNNRLDDLPQWQTLAVELRRAHGCKARSALIEQIAQQGDPAGLKILEYYAGKSTHGCGFLNFEDCYGCIRDDLHEAIDTLESS